MLTQVDFSFAQARPVIVRQWRQLHLVLVGCGGTGSWLAPHTVRLARTLLDQGRAVRVTFVDPDTVEAVNIPRQQFCAAELGAYKAQALALRYSRAWGEEIAAVAAPFTPALVGHLAADDLAVLVGCVDNAAARRCLADTTAQRNDHRYNNELPACWWLDCGNMRETGQVLLGCLPAVDLKYSFVPTTLCNALPLPSQQHPELLEALPDESGATRLSCAELAALNLQSLVVNQAVAAVAADYLLRLLTGGLRKFATYFDLAAGTSKSYYTTPEAVGRVIVRPPDWFAVQSQEVGQRERRRFVEAMELAIGEGADLAADDETDDEDEDAEDEETE